MICASLHHTFNYFTHENNRVVDIARHLACSPLNSGVLPSWLYVNPQSEQSIRRALEYWSKPLQKSTKTLLEAHNNLCSMGQGEAIVGSFPVANDTPAAELYKDKLLEDIVFDEFKVLLPPKALLHLHPALERFVASYKSAKRAAVNSAKEEIFRDWKPNPVLFVCPIFLFAFVLLVAYLCPSTGHQIYWASYARNDHWISNGHNDPLPDIVDYVRIQRTRWSKNDVTIWKSCYFCRHPILQKRHQGASNFGKSRKGWSCLRRCHLRSS